MTSAWSASELERIGAAQELHIATWRADGTLRREVPVWVVRAGDQVYVRTWYRRGDGWFGRAADSRRAHIRMPGVEASVSVADVGLAAGDGGEPEVRAAVDAAYRAKYGRYGASTVDRMVADDAAATTLRLTPERAAPAPR
jgi:hypothetical protein